jgi:hypothetical protein
MGSFSLVKGVHAKAASRVPQRRRVRQGWSSAGLQIKTRAGFTSPARVRPQGRAVAPVTARAPGRKGSLESLERGRGGLAN